MGASHRKPKQLLVPGLTLNYDEVIFILKQNLLITTHPDHIEYILDSDRKYQTVDYMAVEKLLKRSNFEEELTKNPLRAIFRSIGNFRPTVWGHCRRHTCYFFIDNKKLLWIVDPISQSIEIPRYSHQIDQVSSL